MKISIAYINDVHAYLEPHAELFYESGKEVVKNAGGYARIATIVNDIRKKNLHTLFFDGGDTFHGTLPAVETKGEALVPILNKLAFDGMVCHWDFAYGPAQLKKLASELNYSVLGINVYKEDGSLFFKPYILIETGNLKIAVIGICSNIIDKMPERFSKALKVTDGTDELPMIIDEVKSKGAGLVILLSHNGFPHDVEVLKQVPGVDVCLSAHTHNRLYEAIKINDSIVIQCGCHGSFVGHLDIEVEQTKIVAFNYRLITVDESIQPDMEVEQMVEEVMRSYRQLVDEKVGEAVNILHRYDTLNSTMDDLLLAAICAAADVKIGFSNGWRYGAPITAGEISKWDLHNIIPMNPIVSTVELSGEEIVNMLEENLERTFAANAMNQMGGYVKRCFGISVKMRIENPKGYRIQQLFISNKPIKKDVVYKVAFVTEQGVPKELGKNRVDLEIKAVEAMVLYLGKNPVYMSSAFKIFSLV